MRYKMQELVQLAGRLAREYTGGLSTSVTYEKAEQLMGAVLYCIREADAFSEGWETPGGGSVVSTGKGMTAEEAYRRGCEMVTAKVKRTMELYEEIIGGFRAYGNRVCRDTVAKGMPAFFLYYDAKFLPQDHLLTLDYPLLRPLGDLCGVDAIYRYLSWIRMEQGFLGAFSEEYIVDTLVRFDREYEDMPVNLCGVAVRSVIARLLTGRSLGEGELTRKDQDTLLLFAAGKSKEELGERLLVLLETIVRSVGQGNELFDYLKGEVLDLASGLSMAEEIDAIAGLFGISGHNDRPG